MPRSSFRKTVNNSRSFDDASSDDGCNSVDGDTTTSSSTTNKKSSRLSRFRKVASVESFLSLNRSSSHSRRKRSPKGKMNGIPPSPSQDEAQKVINAEVDDVFEDAVQEDADEGIKGEFKVTQEELSIIRADLATEFPDDYLYFSDAYILSVASKPYSKDPTVRRPLEYSQEKLTHVLAWRAESGATDLEDQIKLANGPESAPEAVEDPARFQRAKLLVSSLNTNSLYWHGFTKEGRPILWLRTSRKAWYPDVEAEVNGLVVLADAGIRAMPPGVTDFCCISESSYPPPPNPSFLIKLLKALVRGYPDRLHVLLSAPVSSIIQFVMNLLLPLMPGRLSEKFVLLGVDDARKKLKDLLLHGEDDIPTFFGGPVDHDKWYPEEANCPKRGPGCLKFDYYGMLKRLDEAKVEYMEWAKNNSKTDDDE